MNSCSIKVWQPCRNKSWRLEIHKGAILRYASLLSDAAEYAIHALGNSPQASPTQRHNQRRLKSDRRDDIMGKTDTRTAAFFSAGYSQNRYDTISVSAARETIRKPAA